MGVAQKWWFISWNSPFKWMIQGYSDFRKPPKLVVNPNDPQDNPISSPYLMAKPCKTSINWGFPKIGLPPVIIIYRSDCPWSKPSSYWAYPQLMETPIYLSPTKDLQNPTGTLKHRGTPSCGVWIRPAAQMFFDLPMEFLSSWVNFGGLRRYPQSSSILKWMFHEINVNIPSILVS